MKKLISLLVLGALFVGFAGCSGSDSAKKPAEQQGKEAPGTPKDGV